MKIFEPCIQISTGNKIDILVHRVQLERVINSIHHVRIEHQILYVN